MPLKVNLAHHAFHAFRVVIDLGYVFPQDPPGQVLRRGRAGCCLVNLWPSSSNRSAEACGYSISGW